MMSLMKKRHAIRKNLWISAPDVSPDRIRPRYCLREALGQLVMIEFEH